MNKDESIRLRAPERGPNTKKSHEPGFDDESDPRDYGDRAEDYDGQSLAGPNWNDDAEGYGDLRHGRPAVVPPAPPVRPAGGRAGT